MNVLDVWRPPGFRRDADILHSLPELDGGWICWNIATAGWVDRDISGFARLPITSIAIFTGADIATGYVDASGILTAVIATAIPLAFIVITAIAIFILIEPIFANTFIGVWSVEADGVWWAGVWINFTFIHQVLRAWVAVKAITTEAFIASATETIISVHTRGVAIAVVVSMFAFIVGHCACHSIAHEARVAYTLVAAGRVHTHSVLAAIVATIFTFAFIVIEARSFLTFHTVTDPAIVAETEERAWGVHASGISIAIVANVLILAFIVVLTMYSVAMVAVIALARVRPDLVDACSMDIAIIVIIILAFIIICAIESISSETRLAFAGIRSWNVGTNCMLAAHAPSMAFIDVTTLVSISMKAFLTLTSV